MIHEGIDGSYSLSEYINDLECQVITLEDTLGGLDKQTIIEQEKVIKKQQARINHQRRELRRLNRKILDMIRGARMVTNQATDAIDALEGQ